MATISERSFANVIRERRRQLDLTQEEVALRINTSVPYVGLLEAGKRHPSEKVVTKIAQVLGLDARQLFLLANPGARFLVSEHSDGRRRFGMDGVLPGQASAEKSQHHRRRDANSLASRDDGRGAKFARLPVYPEHDSPVFGLTIHPGTTTASVAEVSDATDPRAWLAGRPHSPQRPAG